MIRQWGVSKWDTHQTVDFALPLGWGLLPSVQFDRSALSGDEWWDEYCLILSIATAVAAEFGFVCYILSLIPDDNPRKLLQVGTYYVVSIVLPVSH